MMKVIIRLRILNKLIQSLQHLKLKQQITKFKILILTITTNTTLINMNTNNQSTRLRLLQQANCQLEKLKERRSKLMLGMKIQNQDKQKSLMNDKSAKVVEMYKHLLKLYPVPQEMNVKNQQDDSASNRSNRKSHYRADIKPNCAKFGPRQVNQMTINIVLSSTLAYIYVNFQNKLEEAAFILLKSREQACLVIQQMLMYSNNGHTKVRKIQLQRNSSHQERNSCEHYQQQDSSFHSIMLSPNISQDLNTNHHNSFQHSSDITQVNLSIIRSYLQLTINLVINLILQNKYTFAVEIFNQLTQFIQALNNQQTIRKCLEYISIIWFNVQECFDFKTLRQDAQNAWTKNGLLSIQRQLSIEEALSMSHFIFNSDLFAHRYQNKQATYSQTFVFILQKSYHTFLEHSMYQHSFFTLRHLLQSPIEAPLKQKYYLLLRSLLESGKLSQNVELQNVQSVQCFRCIIQTLENMMEKYNDSKRINQNKQITKSKNHLFHLIIKIQMAKVSSNLFTPENQRNFILNNLDQMIQESSHQIIEQMLKLEFAGKLIKQVNLKCQIINKFCLKQLNECFKIFHSHLHEISSSKSKSLPLSQKCQNIKNSIIQTEKKSQVRARNVSPNPSRKYLKLISNSIFTESSSIIPQSSHRLRIFDSAINVSVAQQKKICKMVRLCEHGAYLNKRNFNSDGGEFKFIKLTSNCIKWSKNAQKIDESSQFYPLKDIKAILYGKITPNLKKSCNIGLRAEFCFSLVLQKRTMDFYCKDYSQVQTWVCGTSLILKKQNQNIAGYTPAKLRWRKMFVILREAFIQPLKMHERNQYYFENAYSLILFKKNGYKLPTKI